MKKCRTNHNKSILKLFWRVSRGLSFGPFWFEGLMSWIGETWMVESWWKLVQLEVQLQLVNDFEHVLDPFFTWPTPAVLISFPLHQFSSNWVSISFPSASATFHQGLRDGKTESMPVSKLVPGDVIHLRGGALTPADVEWLEAIWPWPQRMGLFFLPQPSWSGCTWMYIHGGLDLKTNTQTGHFGREIDDKPVDSQRMEEEKSKEKSIVIYIYIIIIIIIIIIIYLFFSTFFSSPLRKKGGFGARLNFRFPPGRYPEHRHRCVDRGAAAAQVSQWGATGPSWRGMPDGCGDVTLWKFNIAIYSGFSH